MRSMTPSGGGPASYPSWMLRPGFWCIDAGWPARGAERSSNTRRGWIGAGHLQANDGVVRLCEVIPVRHIAQYFDPSWEIVKELDKQAV